ncbi:MAG: tetratricopeptide repeat protein [Anaerolineae bacterium]
MRTENPYIITPLTGENGFYGRTDILQFVHNTLASPYQRVIVLYGQRRIGKTSLLHQLSQPHHIPPGFLPIYFDLMGRAQQTLGEALYGLAREVMKKLGLPRPNQTDFQEETYFQDQFLPQAYQALGKRQLLFLIDEFDVLGEVPATRKAAIETFFPYLQELILDEDRVSFIFVVGRRLDELPSRIKATFKSAQFKHISVLNRADARRLIVEPARNQLEYETEAVEAILDLAAGHPYFTQLIGYAIFDELSHNGRSVVTLADVEEAVERAMELGMGGLAWFWDEFPPAERFILSAIAHVTDNGGVAHQSRIRQVLREHGVRLQGIELSSAPAVLAEWGIIYQPERDAYRFVVEFLRRWVRTRHSLAEAKRELESVSPRAISLYEAARSAHIEGDLSTAVDDYRRALTANPNHTGAQLGLAQALHEQELLSEAIEAYERAYDLDRASAWDGLLAVRQDYAARLKAEGNLAGAVEQYQQLQEHVPEDPDVIAALHSLLRQQGEAYLANNQMESALAAFQEALNLDPDNQAIIDQITTLRARLRQSHNARLQRELVRRGVLERQVLDEREARERAELRAQRAFQLAMGLAGAGVIISLVSALPLVVRVGLAGAMMAAVAATYFWQR